MPNPQSLLGEFEYEMGVTRAVLSRVPDGKYDWKPHDKSYTFGALASHIAHIAAWAIPTMKQNELDLAPVGGPPYKPVIYKTTAEVLSEFDKNVAASNEVLKDPSEESLLVPWSLLVGGKTIFTMPRVSVFRGFIIKHIVHHRAQLGVYLRLNDISHPAIYGPSADEGSMG